MITAINIKTEFWNKVIKLLINNNWQVIYKYHNFDAGIDHDFIILQKENEEILFGWDNWFEGEIQCKESRLNEIEEITKVKFEIGNAENLKPNVIKLHKKWNSINKWKQ